MTGSRNSCDVLIVGGGPAGSTLAGKLARCGLDVVVLDKSDFPRDKVCAGWITPAALDLLHLEREEYARGRVLQEFSSFRTCMLGGPEILTRYDRTVSYGIRRSEFDHYLLSRAGARLRLGEPLRSMERKNGGWLVNGSLTAPLVVGAGGHFCPVARLLRGGRGPSGHVVIAQEVEFEMRGPERDACPVRADTPELYFCEDLAGYGWCVRKGNYLNIGLGRESSRDFPAEMKAFTGYLKQRGKIPGSVPEHFKGHAYTLYHGVHGDVIDDGVMLIGDAVGLAFPKSGEGIRPAVESAILAAKVILSANKDYRREKLSSYPHDLAGRFGKGDAGSIFPHPLKRLLGRALMKSAWFSRHVVLDRWFLDLRQPPLIS